ncbi:hypothetical protein J6590_083831 [Homalodisca vitripennis]|nr:hypothetical protein J6590_083831 [Homalodisca vitripennis]
MPNVSQHSKKYRPDVDVCSVKKKNNVVDSNVILSQAYERSTTQTAECKTAEQEDQDQNVYSMVDIDCKNDLRDSNIQSTTENRCVQLSSGLINDTVEVDTIDSDELTWKTVSYKKSSSFDQSKSEKCVKGKEPRPIIGLVNKKGNQYGRVTKPVIIGSNTQRGGLKSVERFKFLYPVVHQILLLMTL